MIVVDYGRGNLFSLKQALLRVGGAPHVSNLATDIEKADKIVVPGVGSFPDAMKALVTAGMVGPLHAAINRGAAVLGICVGCQLLLSVGEEFGRTPGLDAIPGTVGLLPSASDGDATNRIPNVGWRRVKVVKPDPILSVLDAEDHVYFVHSFAPYAEPPYIAATLNFNDRIVPVAVRKDKILGVQFHPEKSADPGLKLLEAFHRL